MLRRRGPIRGLQPRRWNDFAGVGLGVRRGVVLLALTQAVGCSSNSGAAGGSRHAARLADGTPAATDVARPEGNVAPPMIISGSPSRDAAGFDRSDEVLTDADWARLETYGPR